MGEGPLSSDLSHFIGKMGVEVLTQWGLWIETVCVKCSAHSTSSANASAHFFSLLRSGFPKTLFPGNKLLWVFTAF